MQSLIFEEINLLHKTAWNIREVVVNLLKIVCICLFCCRCNYNLEFAKIWTSRILSTSLEIQFLQYFQATHIHEYICIHIYGILLMPKIFTSLHVRCLCETWHRWVYRVIIIMFCLVHNARALPCKAATTIVKVPACK